MASLHVFALGQICGRHRTPPSHPALMPVGRGCYKFLSTGKRRARRSTCRRTTALRTPLALFFISLGVVAAVWWWLAIPVTLVSAPIDPAAKLECVSYAPFRGDQTPHNPDLIVSQEQ